MDSNQQNAQFNVVPFQRVDISIGGNVDRSNGEFFPQFEGYGVYVERADFPCFIHLVSQSALLGQAAMCRDGQQVIAPFKGFSITHPPMNVPAILTLVIFKLPCLEFTNNLSAPLIRMPISGRQVTNTALAQSVAFYIPPQTRLLRKMVVVLNAATITLAQLTLTDTNGVVVTGPSTLTGKVSGAAVTYNLPGNPFDAAVPVIVGANAILKFDVVQIPTWANEVFLTITGTGLAVPTFGGYFE